MNLPNFLRRRRSNPGRDLAAIGAERRRNKIKATARRIRAELDLPPHPALEPQK
jgi:hypothetical protein